jgi:ABC-type multidrug transport system permease subunit
MMTKDAEHFFQCLSATCALSFENSLYSSVPQFSRGVVFLLFNILSSLSILGINPLLD